jgi:hypothetical protein
MKVVSRRKLLQLIGERPFVTPNEFASIHAQALVETRKFATSPERALFLLGKERFFSQKKVVRLLSPILREKKLPQIRVPNPADDVIPYSEQTLSNHADGKWLLYWHPGWGLRLQKKIFGTVPTVKAGFFDSKWWLHEDETRWASISPEQGYRLVSLKMLDESRNKKHHEQERAIKKLGPKYRRPSCALVSTAVFLCYLINKGERPLEGENDFHWGTEVDSHGYIVEIGRFNKNGLLVDHDWRDYSGPELGVCPSRAEDF